MSTAGGLLLVGWLVAALVLLGMDGRLPTFLAVAVPGTLVLLGVGSLIHHQLAPSRYNRPPLPERYRVADDLGQPLAAVVAAAEQDATTSRVAVAPMELFAAHQSSTMPVGDHPGATGCEQGRAAVTPSSCRCRVTQFANLGNTP